MESQSETAGYFDRSEEVLEIVSALSRQMLDLWATMSETLYGPTSHRFFVGLRGEDEIEVVSKTLDEVVKMAENGWRLIDEHASLVREAEASGTTPRIETPVLRRETDP